MRGAVRQSVAAAVIALSAGTVAWAQAPVVQPGLSAAGGAARRARPWQQRSGPRRPDQDRRGRRAAPAVRGRQAGRAGAPHGLHSTGFFSIFSSPPPQCGALNQQIEQKRDKLDRMQNQLERTQGGTAERAAQRQSLLIALAENNCGPQYRAAARAGEQGGFFDRLFGGGSGVSRPQPNGADGRHLPHGLRAHLRRLLFPDLVRDLAGPLPRGRADLPAHVPGGRGAALHLSQSRRGHDAGGFAQRPALHRAAECVPLSQGAQPGLQLPAAGRKLGRGAARERRRQHGRAWRHRGDRPERQANCRSRARPARQTGRCQAAPHARGGRDGRRAG